jgi:sugar-specific transcriptional regulator TrmB
MTMSGVLSVSNAYSGASPLNGLEAVIQKLSKFGLSEKEAQLYVHLLKYGPKRAGDLARSLRTYRLGVYRRLAGLIDKTLVTKKRASPAVYTAVDLAEALDTVIASRQRELRLVEDIRSDLVALMNGRHPPTADDPLTATLANGDEQVLVQLLSVFGLSEKERQLYAHLLKYGPKRAGDLARSLKTYREDVYRRCARLIDEGMIVKGVEDKSRYAPVELDQALDGALRAHQNELNRLEKAKQELIEETNVVLNRGQSSAPEFKMLNTVGEVVTAISQLINSAETSIIFAAHQRFSPLSTGGFLDHLKCAIGRDVRVCGVLDISPRNLSARRAYVSCGVELRNMTPYKGITMVLADGKQSVSLIHADIKSPFTFDAKVAAIWSNSVAQSEFLISAFETTWEQTVDAEECLNKLQQPERPSLESASPTYGDTSI